MQRYLTTYQHSLRDIRAYNGDASMRNAMRWHTSTQFAHTRMYNKAHMLNRYRDPRHAAPRKTHASPRHNSVCTTYASGQVDVQAKSGRTTALT